MILLGVLSQLANYGVAQMCSSLSARVYKVAIGITNPVPLIHVGSQRAGAAVGKRLCARGLNAYYGTIGGPTGK